MLPSKAEKIALDTFLSKYPQDISYDQVIEQLSAAPNSMIVHIWFPFEYYPNENIIEYIENLKSQIEGSFFEELKLKDLLMEIVTEHQLEEVMEKLNETVPSSS